MRIDLWNRRKFASAAGSVFLAGTVPRLHAAEPPPETKRIRLPRFPVDVACVAPLWIAQDLLRGEGFDDVRYIPVDPSDTLAAVVAGHTDFDLPDPITTLLELAQGKPLVALSGVHVGCFELFGARGVRTVRDLKGRKIGYADAGRKAFIVAMLGHVGLNAANDVSLVDTSAFDGVRLLADGKIDAYLGFPPEPQQMRADKIGVSIINTAIDRPWAHYFCCLAVGHRDFVARNPVATKRALRALLKATDICAAQPEHTVRVLIERGFLKRDHYAVQALREIPYKRWREYDSADSLRFYALRLHEAGVIKSDPKKLLAQGTDWRFVEQLKKELKS